jgi:predicted HD phosphohydrolase
MMRVLAIIATLSVLAIALMLGWERYSAWQATRSLSYQRDAAICERQDELYGDPRAARVCWDYFERKYGSR